MPLTGPTMTPTVVIPPFNETVAKAIRVRPMAEVTRFGYALEVLTQADPLGIVLGIGVTRVVIGTAGNYAITGNPATTRRDFTAVAAAGSYAVSGVAASLNAPKKLAASTGTFSVVGRPTLLDSDASTYITAVETADGLALEEGVRTSIDIFVRGCKADSIWAAIKASCILSGARTLSGALTPLVGSAPSNVNFVSGDYNRKTGLLGDGSSKYLNSNRSNNADPQDNRHMGVYLTAGVSGGSVRALLGAESAATSGTSLIYNESTASDEMRFTLSSNTTPSPSGAGASSGTATGYVGASRSVSGSFSGRVGGSTATYTSTSQVPSSGNIAVFARTTSSPARYCDCRMAFYSIGESLDLSKLEARITTLANAFSTAIP